jgi:hypothetical protein
MAYEKAEDLYKVFELTLQKVLKDEKLVEALSGTGMIVGIKVPNIDATMTLELKGSLKYSFGPTELKPDVTTVNDDVIFNQFWQGKLNLIMAMTKGQVKSTGAVTKMLKILPKIGPIYKMYAESLKEAGREDLIIK